MFSCSSCLAGALKAVISESPTVSRHLPLTRNTPRLIARSQRRDLTEATSVQTSRKTLEGGKRVRSVTDKVAGQKQKNEPFKDRHLRKELEWLPDPAKLADNIKQLLRVHQFDKALRMTQMASTRAPTTVSWNHILSYLMGIRNANHAWKLFQEMKKRGQKPDSHTYTIMLRGFAQNLDKSSSSLERAVIVYQSMFAPNSAVTPNLIHTNAMLHVCGLAKELDTTLEIASKLPQAGRGAADATTFTTILHTIRVIATDRSLRFGAEESIEMRMSRYEESIRDGKRIWADLIQRWADGDLLLDEQLVCAMGRLLLLTGIEDNRTRNPEHAEDILCLVEQAMGIPLQISRGSSRGPRGRLSWNKGDGNEIVRHEDPTAMQLLDKGGVEDAGSWNVQLTEIETQKRSPDTNKQSDTVFAPLVWKSSEPQAFARPGNNSLSLVLTACGSAEHFAAANRYWNMFSQVVRPDSENCHSYLRVLRAQRASKRSLDLVRQMIRSPQNEGFGVGVEAKTFRIAMSACVRDANNPNSLGSAVELLKEMRQHLEMPDLKTIGFFIGLLKSRREEADHTQSFAAIDMLHALFRELKNVSTFGAFGRNTAGDVPKDSIVAEHDTSGRSRLHSESRAYLYELAKQIESATMRAMSYHSEVADNKTIARWAGQRRNLAKFMGSANRLRLKGHDNQLSETPFSVDTATQDRAVAQT